MNDTSAAPTLTRDAHGRLVLRLASAVHVGVTPVRAFPLTAPLEGLSLVASDGHELAWIEHLELLDEHTRTLIEQELAAREFIPVIQHLHAVSSFSTPSRWQVDTDRGPAELVLKGEEDIRRLSGRTHLLVSASDGMLFRIQDVTKLDRHSRKLLERFL